MITNHRNYQKRLRQLTRLMDAADSGIDCSEKIRAISKSIGRFEDKHYPIDYKRGGFAPNPKKHRTVDRDTWLARHGQSTSLNRSPRAREALSELNLFRIGIPRRFIVAIRKMHEANLKAAPHPKFKPS